MNAKLSGFWFRVPDELIEMLTQLKPAELKAYLVVQHAIQRDKNRGLLSIRQIARRAGVAVQNTQRAITELLKRGLLKASTKAGCTTVYENASPWKSKASDCSPVREHLSTGDCARTHEQLGCSPVDEHLASQDAQHCSPVHERNCARTHEQHLECSEERPERTAAAIGGEVNQTGTGDPAAAADTHDSDLQALSDQLFELRGHGLDGDEQRQLKNILGEKGTAWKAFHSRLLLALKRYHGSVGNPLLWDMARQAAAEGEHRPVSRQAVRLAEDPDVRREALRTLADPASSVIEIEQAKAALGERCA
jgi:hypothetical protein